MIAETIGSNHHPTLIRARWNTSSFSPRKVDVGKLLRLLEAARWTASYANEQPWSFVVVSKDDALAFEQLLSCLGDSSIARARRAPVMILSVVKLNFETGGRRNPYAFHDAGKAVSNLTHKASAMGLLVHQMSGFDALRARRLFEIPSGYTPVTVIAIGYPNVDGQSSDQAPEGTSPTRQPLESLVFTGRWGATSHVLKGALPDRCDDRA